MKCEDFQARYLSGEVDEAVRSHLAGCAACRSSIGSLDELRDALADPVLWEEPPPDLGDRIVAEIRSRTEPLPHVRRPWWMAGVASAAVLLLAALSMWLLSSRPDWRIELSPTPIATEASAVVSGWNTSAGTRMEIDVRGLRAAGTGAYYEVWLTARDGRHVSAGTFNDSGRVVVWAGVRRADYPRIWITLESADHDLGPSPVVVLDTRV